MKGRHDVVTAMDREVERFIRRRSPQRFPGDAIIGEEEGGGGERALWLIDPIDGTANYARGCRIIACRSASRARRARRSAAIYDPSYDWLYARGATARAHGSTASALAREPRCRHRAPPPSSAAGPRAGRRRPTSRCSRACMNAGVRDPPRGLGRAGPRRRRRGPREAYASCTSTRGTARRASCSCARPAASPTISSPGDGLRAGNPVIATNAALCAKLAAVIGIPHKLNSEEES